MIQIKTFRNALALAIGLAFATFFEKQGLKADNTVRVWMYHLVQMFEMPETQWMFILFCVAYYLAMSLVCRFWIRAVSVVWTKEIWFAGVVSGVLLPYFFYYSTASASTDALVVVAGLCIARGVIVVAHVMSKSNYAAFQTVLLALVLTLLTATSLGHGQGGDVYHYQGEPRWSGPWRNPNTCGLLMGVGFVISFGLWIRERRREAHGKDRVMEHLLGALVVVVFGLCLVLTYSRGAWVGTACAIIYLLVKCPRPRVAALRSRLLVRRNGLLCLFIVATCALVAWSGARMITGDSRLEKRLLSFSNINDFSWRNRVSTWEGLLQMIADQPLSGFGWNAVEAPYIDYYRPLTLHEGLAIRVNNYLGSAASAGVLFLACVVGCIWAVRANNAVDQKTLSNGEKAHSNSVWLPVVAQAGAVVLIVGFWFDGGLFNLATAVPFWLLLQLNTLHSSLPVPEESAEQGIAALLSGSLTSVIARYMRWPKVVRIGVALPAAVVAGTFIFPPLQVFASRYYATSKSNASEWVPLAGVSKDFLTAVWMSEDHKFFRHNGFDWEQIQIARSEAKLTGKPARGASTITQQCARSAYLWQGRSWIRKGLEAYYTIWMELLLSKAKILEIYVNVIELGTGVYGVEAAAQHYFGVPSRELTREQAAILVAIMPSPRHWNPLHPNSASHGEG